MVDVIQADARINAKEGDLCVWWIRNVPNKPQYVPVDSPEEARLILAQLAFNDLRNPWVQTNVGGLEVFANGEWEDWYDEHGHDIDEWADLPWTVGDSRESGSVLGRFETHDQGAAFIATLPDYESGIYYLDGPEEEG